MTGLSDRAVGRLLEAASWPELDARYTITGVAGRGGMATVYIARDGALDRDVAIKVLDVADRAGARAARVTREARILTRLDHPGIVPVHDAGTTADGRASYVMKLVRGRRLDLALAEHPTVADRLALFGRVLETMAFAHAAGIVHRDLKPENIMVGRFGEVLVMDWGVAQDEGPEPAGTVVGTPGFMPPEQARAVSAVDARADIFALGVVLTHLLPTWAPRPLVAIAQKACQDDPLRRYQSVGELIVELGRFRDSQPVSAYREPLNERLLRVYRRYELPIVLVLAYLAMRVALLLWARV